jgi:serine/threonine-protein kinase OSR1/STK39
MRAVVKATGEEVAVKKLDLENMNCSLDEIVREAQTMRSLNHPNLLPLYCSFVHEEHLWMVMPYVHGGSILNIMRFRFQDGLEEPAIATIMKEVLKACEYLHRNGIIHRDIKAGNILLDSDGHVMLADFGVAAALERGGSWGNRMISRNTFVGTPCWMAPEVMQQESGYDSKADIWSFGITLLELAHGHAPFARLPPMKVLIMTLQNPPPTLDQTESKKHFSKAMRDIVAKCLVKDPTQRPTAAQLLEHKFFKTAHDAHYLQRHVLEGLPPVPVRVEMMRAAHSGVGGAQHAAQEREILASQQEYRRGVSSWNFDVEALKAAAAEVDRMAAISEGAEVGLSHQISDMSLTPEGSMSPSKVASPTAAAVGVSRSSTPPPAGAARAVAAGVAAGAGAAAAVAAAARPGIKEHGRFKVYEEEPPPFSPPNGVGGQLMDDAMRSRASTPNAALPDDFDGEGGEKAKRKGRFRYVEEDGADGKGRMSKATSAATLDSQSRPGTGIAGASGVMGSGQVSGAPPVTVLLGPMKEMMERATQQYEGFREVIAALSDMEKGKHGALNAFLQQRQNVRSGGGAEEMEKMRSEVNELREENAKLREKVKVLGGEDALTGLKARQSTTSFDELDSTSQK